MKLWTLIIVIFSITSFYALDVPPMKPRKLLIADREFIRYEVLMGGEVYQEVNLVTRVDEDGKVIHVYIGKHNLSSKYPMPIHYTNYQRQFDVSIETGSLIRGFGNYIDQYKADHQTGEVYFSTEINWKKNIAIYISKIWDGYEMMTKTSRVPIKSGYPVWDVPSVAFVGTRYMDYESKGMIYGIVPATVKEAVPVMARFIKKEAVDVPAGHFNTIKLGIGIPDAFLANLLESYVKELYVWIEDAPRGLVVKTQSPTEIYLLKEESVWVE